MSFLMWNPVDEQLKKGCGLQGTGDLVFVLPSFSKQHLIVFENNTLIQPHPLIYILNTNRFYAFYWPMVFFSCK